MKGIFLYILSAAAVCMLVHACGSKDFQEDSQRSRIESYLASLRDSDGMSVEYTVHSGAYRYVYHTDGRSEELAAGDSVYLYLSGYIFYNGPRTLFTTNIAEDAGAAGMDASVLDFSPRRTVLGSGSLVPGLDLALPGVRQGDSLYVFMASDLAYGDRSIGIVPEGSSVAFRVVVDKVIK